MREGRQPGARRSQLDVATSGEADRKGGCTSRAQPPSPTYPAPGTGYLYAEGVAAGRTPALSPRWVLAFGATLAVVQVTSHVSYRRK